MTYMYHASKTRERRGSHGYIGKRVFVVWNACQPYTGTITQYDPFKSNPFFVEYDDGERQWEAAEDVCGRSTHSLISRARSGSERVEDAGLDPPGLQVMYR